MPKNDYTNAHDLVMAVFEQYNFKDLSELTPKALNDLYDRLGYPCGDEEDVRKTNLVGWIRRNLDEYDSPRGWGPTALVREAKKLRLETSASVPSQICIGLVAGGNGVNISGKVVNGDGFNGNGVNGNGANGNGFNGNGVNGNGVTGQVDIVDRPVSSSGPQAATVATLAQVQKASGQSTARVTRSMTAKLDAAVSIRKSKDVSSEYSSPATGSDDQSDSSDGSESEEEAGHFSDNDEGENNQASDPLIDETPFPSYVNGYRHPSSAFAHCPEAVNYKEAVEALIEETSYLQSSPYQAYFPLIDSGAPWCVSSQHQPSSKPNPKLVKQKEAVKVRVHAKPKEALMPTRAPAINSAKDMPGPGPIIDAVKQKEAAKEKDRTKPTMSVSKSMPAPAAAIDAAKNMPALAAATGPTKNIPVPVPAVDATKMIPVPAVDATKKVKIPTPASSPAPAIAPAFNATTTTTSSLPTSSSPSSSGPSPCTTTTTSTILSTASKIATPTGLVAKELHRHLLVHISLVEYYLVKGSAPGAKLAMEACHALCGLLQIEAEKEREMDNGKDKEKGDE